MRKAGSLFAIFVAGSLAVGTVLLFLVDGIRFRPAIQAQLESRLRRSVNLGPMGPMLIPLAVRVEGVEIGESLEFASPIPFARARQMGVRVGLAARGAMDSARGFRSPNWKSETGAWR
jgi:hypothetical protein